MPSSLSRYSYEPKTKRIFEYLWGIFDIISFIHFYPHGYAHGRSLRHILDKITKWHFRSTSNEVIWPPKNSNSMHGLKSAILTIFQKSAKWLDWPCPVSVQALQNCPQDLFSLLFFTFHLFFWIWNHYQKLRLVFWSFRSRFKQCGFGSWHQNLVGCRL